MEKLYNNNFFLCSTLFFIGGLATLSITPFSISPLIFILGLGVYIVHKIKSLKKNIFYWVDFRIWLVSIWIVLDWFGFFGF